MKPGGGKRKGTRFEREVCVKLSLWVSHGEDKDLFWRSAISGGRATVLLTKGRSVKPAGDICAVDPNGHRLTDRFFIECKHVRDLQLHRFMLHEGTLHNFWEQAVRQAVDHKRTPMLIARQDFLPVLLIVLAGSLRQPYPLAEVGHAAVHKFEDVLRTTCRL